MGCAHVKSCGAWLWISSLIVNVTAVWPRCLAGRMSSDSCIVVHGGGTAAAGYVTSAGGGVRLQHGSLLDVCPAVALLEWPAVTWVHLGSVHVCACVLANIPCVWACCMQQACVLGVE